jgi:Uma2 family endonuclease
MKAVVLEMPKRWLAERQTSDASQWDEMWEGVLHIANNPSGEQQDIEGDLASYLKRRWARPLGGLVRTQANLTTPDDEADWRSNYRIPDIVLLSPDRLHIDRDTHMVGAPLVCVEIRSPGDETYEKLPFYAALGVPEVWVIDRHTKRPEVFRLTDGAYQPTALDADGWVRSAAVNVELRATGTGRLAVRLNGDPATLAELPE